MSPITVLLVVSGLSLAAGNIGVPVLLFRDVSSKTDVSRPLAGHTLSSDDFSAQLLDFKTPELSVIFAQDQLSSEDFLRLGKDMKRGGLFQNVQKYTSRPNSVFYPSVKSPVHGLSKLIDLYDERIELNEADKVAEYITQTKLVKDTAITIHLYPTADEETAARALAKNDELIGDVMKAVEASGLTYVAIYTAKAHRKHHEAVVVQGVGRHLLQAEVEEKKSDNSTVFYFSNNETQGGCMMYAEDVKVNGADLPKGTSVDCKTDNITMDVTIGKDITMTFNRSATSGMWYLVTAEVSGKLAGIKPDISAPLRFSYHCNEGLEFYEAKGNTSMLVFKRLQIQVFNFKEASKFGMAYDCTGFFTIPLWTGLLLSLLLILVTVYGINMLSNIQTFDLYDDPKGKPLQVNVSE